MEELEEQRRNTFIFLFTNYFYVCFSYNEFKPVYKALLSQLYSHNNATKQVKLILKDQLRWALLEFEKTTNSIAQKPVMPVEILPQQ